MKTKKSIKICIVDASDVYRRALIEVLKSEGFHIFIEAADEGTMLEKLTTNKPDVLLYDFFNCSERFHFTVAKIKKASPKTKLIVMDFSDDPYLIELCLEEGANGFCDKNIWDFKEFAKGIEKISNGETFVFASQII